MNNYYLFFFEVMKMMIGKFSLLDKNNLKISESELEKINEFYNYTVFTPVRRVDKKYIILTGA